MVLLSVISLYSIIGLGNEKMTAKVFELQVEISDENSDANSLVIEWCTATLIRSSKDGTLRLLTAFHCLKDNARYSIFDRGVAPSGRSTSLSPNYDEQVLEAQIVRTDKDSDLAELSTTKEFLATYQNEIENYDPRTLTSRQSISLAAVGVLDSQLNVRYTRGFDWPYQYGYTVNSSIDTRWYEFNDLFIERGFSGGAVFDTYKNFIGLISQFKPGKSTIVVPSNIIENFLKLATSTDKVGAPCRGARVNSFTDSGKNTGIDGGRSCESQEELKLKYGRWVDHPLRDFIDPNEGATNPMDPAMLILGIDQMSVDGQESLIGLPSTDIVERPKGLDRYPSREIRQGIVSRLSGTYFSGIDSTFTVNSTKGGHTTVTESNALSMTLNISEKKPNGPEITFWWSVWNGHGKLIIETENDSKTIRLKGHIQLFNRTTLPIQLECDNNNYKRLVCVSATLAMSLHLENPGQNKATEKMKFKWAARIPETEEVYLLSGDLTRGQ